MDITESAFINLVEDFRKESRISEEQEREKKDNELKKNVEEQEEALKAIYKNISLLMPDKFPKEVDTAFLSSVIIPELDNRVESDTSSEKEVYEISNYNIKASNFNSLREAFISKRTELQASVASYREFKATLNATSNLITLPKSAQGGGTTRKLNKNEVESILKYSGKNEGD